MSSGVTKYRETDKKSAAFFVFSRDLKTAQNNSTLSN